MPTYCFTTKEGETVERWFPMGKAPEYVRLEDGRRARRDILAEHGEFRPTCGNWPILSDALGVHPSQVAEATAQAHSVGVPTEFRPDGRAVLRSPEHRKRFAEALGFYDLNGGYGDPQRKTKR